MWYIPFCFLGEFHCVASHKSTKVTRTLQINTEIIDNTYFISFNTFLALERNGREERKLYLFTVLVWGRWQHHCPAAGRCAIDSRQDHLSWTSAMKFVTMTMKVWKSKNMHMSIFMNRS